MADETSNHPPGDSGYGSGTRAANQTKCTALVVRKPDKRHGIDLFTTSSNMDTHIEPRINMVRLEVENMLRTFPRTLEPGPEKRQLRFAIKIMVMGKIISDPDAEPCIVVVCPPNVEQKIHDFLDPLVKSISEAGGDNAIAPIKVVVYGSHIRNRVSTCDIEVCCGAVEFHDNTKTFCGTPIHIRDALGRSRHATFGGIIKVTSFDGNYHLYGLTAGHVITDWEIGTDESEVTLTAPGKSLREEGLSDQMMKTARHQVQTALPTMSDHSDHDRDKSYSHDEHIFGRVLSAGVRKSLGPLPVDGEQSGMGPYLDWALFELDTHRPNQLTFDGREHSKGDLRLPSSVTGTSKEGVIVTILCPSNGVKRGMLSPTRARVMLDHRGGFTDAYIISLRDSEGKCIIHTEPRRNHTNADTLYIVSDGDSGSWVVDELHLEVFGHVIGDDVFGDAYVIPMDDILTDIQKRLGVRSVHLPTEPEVIFGFAHQHRGMSTGSYPRDLVHIQSGLGPRMGLAVELPHWTNTSLLHGQPSQTTPAVPTFTQHSKVEHPERSCAVCFQSFPTRSKLEQHASVSKHLAFACTCGTNFARAAVLARHIYSQKGPMNLCDLCDDKGFPRLDKLIDHLRHHHKVEESALGQYRERLMSKWNKSSPTTQRLGDVAEDTQPYGGAQDQVAQHTPVGAHLSKTYDLNSKKRFTLENLPNDPYIGSYDANADIEKPGRGCKRLKREYA